MILEERLCSSADRSRSRPGNQRTTRVLSVAYPQMPVAPGSGGGSEQILRMLDAGLVRAGLDSTVLAAVGSQVSGHLIETPGAEGSLTDEVREQARRIHCEEILQAIACRPVDLIHYHGLDFLGYRPQHCGVSELVTLHLPLDWYGPELFHATGLAMNCVSTSQARSALPAHFLPVITNGIELNRYCVSDAREDYLLWLGRICPEKGTDIALRVAAALHVPLIAAGPVHPFPSHLEYFETQVRPRLDTLRRHIGAIETDAKARLLSEARCVLIPSLAAETSSLVAMEAIASGTPVVAFRSGALPEIVEDGVTGFIVDTEDEMAKSVSRTDRLSRGAIRRRAEARFSSEEMTKSYLALYERIAEQSESFRS